MSCSTVLNSLRERATMLSLYLKVDAILCICSNTLGMIATALSVSIPLSTALAAVSLKSKCNRSNTPDKESYGDCFSLKSVITAVLKRYARERIAPDDALRTL